MEIIHVALRTGFSFKKVFSHIGTIADCAVNGVVGVADEANTFCHPKMEIVCDKRNKEKPDSKIRPIFGVRLTVVEDATIRMPPRGQFGKELIFIAKNTDGLQEIYRLVKKFYKNFYYRGNLSYLDVCDISDNVYVIAEDFQDEISDRVDFLGLSPRTPNYILEKSDKPRIALCDNYYPRPWHKSVYELFTAPATNNRVTPQYIMNTVEYKVFFKNSKENLDEAIRNTHVVAENCNVRLLHAPMIRFHGAETIEFLCKNGARKKGIDITSDGEYKSRYEMELSVIKEKDYTDYFLVVADLVGYAKKKNVFVGPSRGSAAGSLVCYLLSITEIDPIPYDLLFERFIDLNRNDLPDIDIDFPDDKRQLVIKYLRDKYGENKVKQIGTVSTMKPIIAISEWARGLRIPDFETDALKNSIVKRASGDARAAMRLADTFTTEVGKAFIEEFPAMLSVSEIEGHPRHSGIHAAGVIVCNEDIEKFAGVNVRAGEEIVMTDKKEAEYLNLLKIDILGLRTLTILSDCCTSIGMKSKDLYSMSFDDQKTFGIFNDLRLSGIFQFEGSSVGALTRKMGVRSFEDIIALTSLARPGALYSGGAARYVKYRIGEEETSYVSEQHRAITGNSYGIVVYQEQMLRLCREIAGMTWEDVNALRRAMSKSLGKEFFQKYKDKFISGAIESGHSQEDSEFLWGEIEHGGAYAFNRSHAVAYAMISYWCAYMKAHHHLEFLVANLNHAKGDDSALKILRDAVVNDGIKYVPVDADESEVYWSVKNGTVVGGLTNIDGVGLQTANKIIAARNGQGKLGRSMIIKLANPVTNFDILFPTEHYWGDIFKRPRVYGLDRKLSKIEDVQGKGTYVIIGKLRAKNVRDLNEYVNLIKRGGKVLEKDSLMLAFKVEDDTDSIMCNINRFDYEDIGRDIAETGVVDKSWYIIRGEIKYEGRYLAVEDIQLLTEELLEK